MPHALFSALNDRRTAYETGYALAMQDAFLGEVRAAREAGRWAANAMGMMGEAAKDYAASVVDALVAHASCNPVFHKISTDFDAHGVSHTPQWLKRQLSMTARV